MTLTTEARFAGVWSVTRDIEDHAGGPSGRFRGIARLTPEAGGLRYSEQGWLTLGAQKMQARRAYLWRFEGETGVAVLFEDGRAFHRFDWARAESRDEHQCESDHYAVRYSFARETWHQHYRVTGPFKDYETHARYLRVTPEAPLAGEGRSEYRVHGADRPNAADPEAGESDKGDEA